MSCCLPQVSSDFPEDRQKAGNSGTWLEQEREAQVETRASSALIMQGEEDGWDAAAVCCQS